MELITPNPKLKLLEQVREVMRLKHYSIRTERTYCDWIRRYIQFHKMQNREELQEGEAINGSPIHARDGLEAWTNLFPYRIEPCRRKRWQPVINAQSAGDKTLELRRKCFPKGQATTYPG